MKQIILLISSVFISFLGFGQTWVTVSEFTWDTDPSAPSVQVAEQGPNGVSWGSEARQKDFGSSGTDKGLAPGAVFGFLDQDISLEVPNAGNIFNEEELAVSIDYRRGIASPEGETWFFLRDDPTDSDPPDFRFGIQNDGTLTFSIPYHDGVTRQIFYSEVWFVFPPTGSDPNGKKVPPDEVWRNYKMEYDKVLGHVRIYIDGVLVKTRNNPGAGSVLDWTDMDTYPMFIAYGGDGEGWTEAQYDNAKIEKMDIVFPITLSSFSGNQKGMGIELNWETQSEINNDFFTIERSYDGGNYEDIAEVKGAGNHQGLLKYKLMDEAAQEGINYYRLSQTDLNGDKKYFQVIEVSYAIDGEGLVSVYPNPSSSEESIRFSYISKGFENTKIEIFDLQGSQYFSSIGQLEPGLNHVTINEQLAKGLYLLKITSNGKIYTERILKR